MEEFEKQETAVTEASEQNEQVKNEVQDQSAPNQVTKKPIKALPIIIVVAVLILAVAGTCIYLFALRSNTPGDALDEYCSAYNGQKISDIKKNIFGEFDEKEFESVSSYSVISFELLSENSNFAVGEAVMSYTLKNGNTAKDSFTIYFKKDGREWKLCSSIIFTERSNTFVTIR